MQTNTHAYITNLGKFPMVLLHTARHYIGSTLVKATLWRRYMGLLFALAQTRIHFLIILTDILLFFQYFAVNIYVVLNLFCTLFFFFAATLSIFISFSSVTIFYVCLVSVCVILCSTSTIPRKWSRIFNSFKGFIDTLWAKL